MAIALYDLTENIRISYETILKMQFIPNATKLALLKMNERDELFIEIIDFSDNTKKQITFNETLFSAKYQNVLRESQTTVNHVFEFHAFENLECYYLKASVKKFENGEEMLHLTIDSEGKTICKSYVSELKTTDDYHFLKEYAVSEDLVFLNLKTFDKTDLSDFLDDFFEEDDFYWIRHIETRYSIFTLANKNLFGLVFFDKDGEMPRGKHTIFEMEDLQKPKLIFSYRIDEWGNNYVFNETGTKIAYFRSVDFGKIQITIRTLSENEFEKAIKFDVHFSKDSSVPQNLILSDNDSIVLIFYNRMEMYNIQTTEQIGHYDRDIGTPYCFYQNKLFYIHANKLVMAKV